MRKGLRTAAPTERLATGRTYVDGEPVEVYCSYGAYRQRLLPQVVPQRLLSLSRKERHELASVEFINQVAIAFVVDNEDGYSFVSGSQAREWEVNPMQLLADAMQNLREISNQGPSFYQLGTGERLILVWETFDGYDASRILLTQNLNRMAARVAGNPVIAIPHRDYLVMFGDADPDFVAEMAEKVYQFYRSHMYPVTPRLFTLQDGNLLPYEETFRMQRMMN